MASEEPPFLAVGTEVSAKYRGAFCEAKVKKVVKLVKIKVTVRENNAHLVVTDEEIRGPLKQGLRVEVKLPDSGQYAEATINKITDCSTYTVVFDDADENTLRRTQLCLKGEKHFVKSETLDQLPLTHPEHFGTPVMKPTKKRRRAASGLAGYDSESEEESSDDSEPPKRFYKGRLQDMIGRILCMELEDRKKTLWVPVLVINPNADDLELKTKDHLLVRSFKDSKYYAVTKKETKEFNRDMAIKNEDKVLKNAFEKALTFCDRKELPSNWDREEMLGTDSEASDDDDSSDDEPSEEKDRFVAQLYKFMDDRGTPINKAPVVGSRDLSLYKLFRVVQNLGGYNKVTNQMKWKQVYTKMNLPASNTASNQMKAAYKKYLHAFEDFYRKLGSTMGTISRPGRSRHNSSRSLLSFRERESPRSPRSVEKKLAEDKKEEDKSKNKESKEAELSKEADEEKNEKVKAKTADEKKPAESESESDSPRKSRTRLAQEEKKKGKEKEKEEEPKKRITREDMARMAKVEEKVKEAKKEDGKREEISRRSKGTVEKEQITKKEEITTRRSSGKGIEKDDTPKKSKVERDEKKTKVAEKEEKGDEEKKDTKSEPKQDPKLLKKKTKKKKSEEEEDKKEESEKEEEEKVEEPPIKKTRQRVLEPEFPMGTKLKVKYGRGRNQKLYEAKVVEAEMEGSQLHYLVHYAGWNNRYDEWVQKERIVGVVGLASSSDVIKKPKQPSPHITTSKTKLPLKKKSQDVKVQEKSDEKSNDKDTPSKTSKSQTNTPPVSKPVRPTRQTSVEPFTSPPQLKGQRRTRRNSGYAESMELQSHISDSDSEESSLDSKEDLGSEGKVASPIRIMEFPKADDGMSSKDEEERSTSPQSLADIDDLDELLGTSVREALEATDASKIEADRELAKAIESAMEVEDSDKDDKDKEDEEKMFTDSEEEKPELKKEDLNFDINLALKDDEESMEDDQNSEPPVIDKEVSDKEEEPQMPEIKATKKEKEKEEVSPVKEKPEEQEKKEKPKKKKERRKQEGKKDVAADSVLGDEEERMIMEICQQLDREDEEKRLREAREKEEEKEKKKREKEKGKGKGDKKKGEKLKEKEKEKTECKPDSSGEKEKKSETEKKKIKKKVKKKGEEKEKEKKVEEEKSEVLAVKSEEVVGAVIETVEAEPLLPPGEAQNPEPVASPATAASPAAVWRPVPEVTAAHPMLPINTDALTAMANIAAAADPVRDEASEQLADDEDSQEPTSVLPSTSASTQASSQRPLPSGAREEKSSSEMNQQKSSVSSMMPTATVSSAMLLDNTPPDTPEHSPSGSSHGEASPHSQDESISLRSDEGEADAEPPRTAPPGGESPNFDMSTHSSSGSSGNVPSSESSGESSMMAMKRKHESDSGSPAPTKKKKRGHKRSVTGEKSKTPKHPHMSDSDEASTQDSHASPSKSARSTVPLSGGGPLDAHRPPRPAKFNFNLEEGKYLEGDARITFLVEKVQEIRKIYMSLKTEVAGIDRRRKRHRRKEKEGRLSYLSPRTQQSAQASNQTEVECA